MKKKIPILFFLTICSGILAQEPIPEITGSPEVTAPKLLDWPTDFDRLNPDLTEPTSNRIYDLHMQVADCDGMDLIISTSGNYHMALTDYWYEVFLPKYPEVKNWYFSTSPPISVEQTANKELSFSNVGLKCAPHLAVGPAGIMRRLESAGFTEGEPIPLFTNRGNVLLVKRGNPKNIRNIWDLAKPKMRVATSNPFTEPGSFGNYASSIYNIALNDRGEAKATKLFNTIFGNNRANKWVTGERIHHREVPHLIFTNQADAGPIFYHLARYMTATFPDEFDIVPLGGTVESPDPLPGNRIGRLFIVRIKGNLTANQITNREAFIKEIIDGSFDPFLLEDFIDPLERCEGDCKIEPTNDKTQISDQINQHVVMYPNPTTGTLRLNWSEELKGKVSTVELLSLSGESLQTHPAEKLSEISFDMSSLEKGLYIVRYTFSDQSKIIRKIIKQ
ncbi:substrate-binding domain-containing protein [Flavobacteriaceae bacterium M23B6Z8]